MKKIIKALTYAEILTVVIIIGLTSSIGMIKFFDFLKGKEIDTGIQMFINSIELEDKKITKTDIFDYKIFINTNNNDLYIIYENIHDNNKIVLDYKNDISQISFEGDLLEEEELEINIYEQNKLLYSSASKDKVLNYSFNPDYEYKIEGAIIKGNKKIKINGIEIKRLGLYLKNLHFTKIVNPKNLNEIKELEINNIQNNKSFLYNGEKIESDFIIIYFEKDGKEKFINITNNKLGK